MVSAAHSSRSPAGFFAAIRNDAYQDADRNSRRVRDLVQEGTRSLDKQRADLGLGCLLYSPLTIYRIYRHGPGLRCLQKVFFH